MSYNDLWAVNHTSSSKSQKGLNMSAKKIIEALGYDGSILALTAIAAALIGMLDFVGFLGLELQQLTQLVLIGIGLLMGAVIAQTSRRTIEMKELKEALGLAEVQMLETGEEFAQHLVSSVTKTKKLVWDTKLTVATPSVARENLQEEYQGILYNRVAKGSVEFKRVEVIIYSKALERVVYRLLLYEKQTYFIRYYPTPPKAIPILNIMAFDEDSYYIGGFHTSELSGNQKVLYIRQPELGDLLKDYWNYLWSQAIPLNEGGEINWKELEKIGKNVGIEKPDFDTMVERLKNEVQSKKSSSQAR